MRAVACDEAQALAPTAFWQRVQGLSEALRGHPARRWALVCSDSAWFVAGLLALARAGRTSVIPQAPQAGSLVAGGTRVDGVLTDRPAEFPGAATLCLTKVAPAGDGTMQLPDDDAAIEFYTSGSSGAPKCAPCTFGLLRHEVLNLENQWGASLGDALVLGTVPHHHRYGMVARILWPLLTGRTFVTHACAQPAELHAWATRQTCAIVSSPAFLSRIDDIALLPPSNRVAAVFSAGAPLPEVCVQRLAHDWGRAATEIYGSTETGSIASRSLSTGDEHPGWQPISGVQVELRTEAAGSRLWVKSPCTVGADWMPTGDLARLRNDGRLDLLGRADDVLKLEDKRVSLSEMRARLGAHRWVESAQLLPLAGRRQTLGAVVILNDEGRRHLAVIGKLATSRELRSWLRHNYEPVLIPRKWRFVEALALNDMGKIEASALRRLFGNAQ